MLTTLLHLMHNTILVILQVLRFTFIHALNTHVDTHVYI